VMVMQPRILILDEPVSQLDPIAASDFIATIKKLCREFGISVIAAEQRLEELIPVCDRILALGDGRTVAFGETRKCVETLINDERFTASMPASAKLFSALSKEDRGGTIPLSVGEGRRFLKDYLNAHTDITGMTGKIAVSEVLSQLSAPVKKNEDTNRSADQGREGDASGETREDPKRAAAQDEYALEFKEVYLKYERNGRDILRSLSFKVKKGEIFCLLGGNGAGKSTAVSAAAGLIKPYSGKIKVFGKNIRDHKGQELYRECLAMLPQDVQTVFITDDINGRHPYDLSGGEQQLAALEIVLAGKPKLLLLDEPTKGLDSGLAEKLRERLKKLTEKGMTIVIVTHDVEFAALIADRCAMIFNGEVVSVSEAREFFEGNYFYTTALNRITRGIIPGRKEC